MDKRNVVLIVDDEVITRKLFGKVFEQDYNILEAKNGKEAIEILNTEAQKIAIMFLDIIMPDVDGFTVLEYMNNTNIIKRIPVFLITADMNNSIMKRGYELGAKDIVGKPFNAYFLKNRVDAMVELYNARDELLHVVRHQSEAIIEKQMEIRDLNNALIESFATAIEFRDFESGEHVKRIRFLTKLLLTTLRRKNFKDCDFTDEEIEEIATAAVLHDIGKIAIPNEILNKPGKLTKEEFEIMKTHTTKGCEMLPILQKIRTPKFYQYAYDICRHHHEKWDGKGYPDGLKGNKISIWVQVVSLADCYDALVSDRVYKAAYSHEEAAEMILNGECGAFNPKLLQCFKEMSDTIKSLYN